MEFRIFILASSLSTCFSLVGPGPSCAEFPRFSGAVAIDEGAKTDLAEDSRPYVATDAAGTWLLVWEHAPGAGARRQLTLARSSDSGSTWQVSPWPRRPESGQGHGEPALHHGNGTWVLAWSSDDSMGDAVEGTYGSDRDILYSRSTDGGRSWSRTVALNSNAGVDWGDDDGPRLATDGRGTWLAVWRSVDSLRNTVGGDSDLFFARSVDDGASWDAPQPLVQAAARDRGFDVEPSLAYGDGVWIVVWSSDEGLGQDAHRDRDVLFSRSTDSARTWTEPRLIASNGAEDFRGDFDPVIATDGQGAWICVYSSADTQRESLGWDRDLLLVRSSDGGGRWSAPRALDSRAASDAGDDHRATLAADASGRWIVVWESWDTLGGTIGGDADLLMMHSDDGGLAWSPARPVETAAASDRGADQAPALAVGAGRWVLAWASTDPRGDLFGIDADVLVTSTSWPSRATGPGQAFYEERP